MNRAVKLSTKLNEMKQWVLILDFVALFWFWWCWNSYPGKGMQGHSYYSITWSVSTDALSKDDRSGASFKRSGSEFVHGESWMWHNNSSMSGTNCKIYHKGMCWFAFRN
jgi:hypothetical protein